MTRTEQVMSIMDDKFLVSQLQRDIKEEIYKAVKIPKSLLIRKALNPLINLPTRRFSEFIADIDNMIRDNGFVDAARQAISRFCDDVVSIGEKNVPLSGPLIIASNHPGTYDGFAIISKMPRNDIKLIVSGIPFFRNLPNACEHLIYSTHDTFDRMEVLRKSVRHLKGGGALLIFPSGRIDPDPSVLPGARDGLSVWSRSVEIFMRKVPEANLLLTITSGVLSKKFINHPLTRFFSKGHERRRVMEFMQVIRQMIIKELLDLHPKVTFADPVLSRNILKHSDTSLNSLVINKAQQLLDYHIERFYPLALG